MQANRTNLPCFGVTLTGSPTSASDRRALAFAVKFGAISGDTGQSHGPENYPADQPMPGWASLPGDAATCNWCGHTSARGDMTWYDSEDDGRGWECENESACYARLDAQREA